MFSLSLSLQSFENVRKVLENCNVDNDIDLFVSEKKTGTDRPAPLRYVNYYHPSQPEPASSKPARPEGAREAPNKALPPIPTESGEAAADPADDGQPHTHTLTPHTLTHTHTHTHTAIRQVFIPAFLSR